LKITILKNYRDKETLRNVEIEALVQMIAECKYQEEGSELRSIYPILKLKREDDGQIDGAENYTDRIPPVCFASVLANINGQRVNKGYTALALLEVNNLTTLEEAEAIRNGAALMPQKLASMVYRCSSLFVSMGAKVLLFYEICIACALYSDSCHRIVSHGRIELRQES
jgi:hypothetical protein